MTTTLTPELIALLRKLDAEATHAVEERDALRECLTLTAEKRVEAEEERDRLREVLRSHLLCRVVDLDGREHGWNCINCCPDAEAETEATVPHTDECPLKAKP